MRLVAIRLLVLGLAAASLSCKPSEPTAPAVEEAWVDDEAGPASEAAEAAVAAPEHAVPWIEHPTPGQRVTRDTLPVWIRSDEGRALEGLTVTLNGRDVSASFPTWGHRRVHRLESVEVRPGETIGTVRPRPGANRLEIRTGGADAPTAAVDFEFAPEGVPIRIRVTEAGRDVPARVSFRGLDGTPTPFLAAPVWRDIAPERHEDRRSFLYTSGEPELVHLPEGRYEVLATRGPAYSMARAEIGPGDPPEEVQLEIARVMDTRGWISADFHVHAIASADSALPLPERLAGFRAQDVDALVASDHWIISDYAADLGAGAPALADVGAIPGVEIGVFPSPQGHWNFWPLARDESSEDRSVLGARSYGGRRPRGLDKATELYAHFRSFNEEARRRRFGDFPVIVQLNHPRGIQMEPFGPVGRLHDYLRSMEYDPALPLDEGRNARLLRPEGPGLPRPIDVDAIELLNRLAYGLYLEVRDDWFGWIRGGFVPTAMANTDSHWTVVTEAGWPRNWVRYDGPRPVEAEPLARAVRARQVVGSTGPLIELSPWSDDGRPVRGPVESLRVVVRGPAWMPIEEVRVLVDGELAAVRRLPPSGLDPLSREEQVHRLEIPLALEADAFVVVEAGDDLERLVSAEPHDGPLGHAFPDVRVLAFTNPLLVDVDGDGTRWDHELARPR